MENVLKKMVLWRRKPAYVFILLWRLIEFSRVGETYEHTFMLENVIFSGFVRTFYLRYASFSFSFQYKLIRYWFNDFTQT